MRRFEANTGSSMSTDLTDLMEETVRNPDHRRLGPSGASALSKGLAATVAVVALLALMTGSALAAPSFSLSVSHTPSVPSISDGQVQFTATATNSATGSTAVGTQLACDRKTWAPTAVATAPSFTYQWRRNGVAIPGATSSTYRAALADAGKVIQCLVTGTNFNGASTFASLPAYVVDPQPATAPPAPASTTVGQSRPTITGTGTAQRTCTAPANWTAGTTYEYQWLRNGVPFGAPSATNTYTPDAGPGGADVNVLLQCLVVGTNAGGSLVGISNTSTVGSVPSAPNNTVANQPAVLVDPTDGSPVTLSFSLPQGMRVFAVTTPAFDLTNSFNVPPPPSGWTCTVPQPTAVTCTRSDALGAGGSYQGVKVVASLFDPVDPSTATMRVSGGGATQAVASESVSFGPPKTFGILDGSFTARAFDAGGVDDYTVAGGHPVSAVEEFRTNTRIDRGHGFAEIVGFMRTATTELPRGFVGNIKAIPERCTAVADILADTFAAPKCPRASIVGGITAYVRTDGGEELWSDAPIYAVPADKGIPAQFMFGYPGAGVTYSFAPRLRPEDDYSIKAVAPDIVRNPPLGGLKVTLCSYGAKVQQHGFGAGFFGIETAFAGCKLPTDGDANPIPLLTNQPLSTDAASCAASTPTTRLLIDSWSDPGVYDTADAVAPALTECDEVPFTPSATVTPTSSARDSASGLDAEITIPSNGLESPTGVSQANLKKTVVELPEGLSVNPSGATGLKACSDEQIGFGTDDKPACPEAAKIGSIEATTPVLEEQLAGDLVLRTPKSTDPESGQMLRMALIVRNDERGILVKLPGTATADADTGRLTATFDQNPQLPLGEVNVHLKSGPRGVLATPTSCGSRMTSIALTPWDDVASTANVDTPYDVQGDCTSGFAPKLDAGMDNAQARGTGAFSFKFSREDGEQWVDGLTARLPQGLLASVKDVPLCSSADAEAGSCPAGSRIGSVDATAGSGTPFVLERKGDAFLTEGYKGCAYGLMVKVPVVAGPFDGSSPETDLGSIAVRQSVCVDPADAHVTATSDAFPTIWHGIPLRVRSVTVKVDRPGFMLNPSDCSPKQVGASLHSDRGNTADAASPFHAAGCGSLPFKPSIKLGLNGRKQVKTGRHPGIKAVVTQAGVGEAGIEKAVVRLPKSLALDPNNAQALCEFEDGTRPDLENHCPKGSIVGRARARTPLLNRDLVGNVYFVKNVRKDPRTGNLIRTLPMIVVALRGEIAVNLEGESSTTRGGKLVNTFASVPDAPISQFNLNIKGGGNGILAVTGTQRGNINLCTKPRSHVAEVDTDGQNGKRHDFDVRMKTPCTKKQIKAAKRKAAKRAKRAAARRR